PRKDDLERRLLERDVGWIEKRGHEILGEISSLHLVERDERRSPHSRAWVLERRDRRVPVGDADQGVDQRVLEKAIAARADRLEERQHRALVADPPQRGRRLPPYRRGVGPHELF